MEDPSINYIYFFIVVQFFEWHVNFLEMLSCYHQNYFTELERLQICIYHKDIYRYMIKLCHWEINGSIILINI